MERIRILHIIKSLGRGGAEMLLPESLQIHDKESFDFHYIYFLPWKNQMVESIQRHGGKVTCFSANSNIQLMLKLSDVVDYVKENEIQLIHAHLPWAGILARMVSKVSGIPVLYTEHNKQERYHFLTRWMNLTTINWLTRIIPVSADVKESILKYKPRLRIPINTILNGVNIDHFKPNVYNGAEIKTLYNIPKESPVIGTIAVFRFQKRLDIWLEVAKEILKARPEAHFIIVGDGPLKELLHSKTKELGIETVVHFAGLQTEVRPYLAAFDIFMMSSLFEGLPIAMLEAMSSGLPVVSTDAGGIKEVIRSGSDGLLCPVEKPHELKGLILSLLNDDSKKNEIGINARIKIKQEFSMQKMAAELENIYREVV